jgi:hypothetical protein
MPLVDKFSPTENPKSHVIKAIESCVNYYGNLKQSQLKYKGRHRVWWHALFSPIIGPVLKSTFGLLTSEQKFHILAKTRNIQLRIKSPKNPD